MTDTGSTSWNIEEKPYNTGQSYKGDRPKVVLLSPDGKMKVTIEMTEATPHAVPLTSVLATSAHTCIPSLNRLVSRMLEAYKAVSSDNQT